MTKTETYLSELPDEAKALFIPVFGSSEGFYATTYLIARNEHITSQEKPEQWEQKVEIIHFFQQKTESFLNSIGLDGKELLADIASDYFEDFVNYKERDFNMSNDDFLTVIRKIQTIL